MLVRTILLFAFLAGCKTDDGKNDQKPTPTMGVHANVTAVQATGTEQQYSFQVTLQSPDTGCEQYADWWEVISEDEELIYRRILLHSHVNEQPFTRSGGPVNIDADQTVWVRAHMNNTGYGGDTFKGSPEKGFSKATMPEDFATALESQSPLPDDCDF